MTTLKEGLGRPARGAGAGERRPGTSRWRRADGWQAAVSGLPALVRRHWIFALALALAVVPRAVAMLGYQPAMLFRLDAYDYLWGAVRVSPNPVNPSGYSLFLWVFRPFHSLALIAGLQHVLGLAVATMVYALLRRYGLPAWGATLAALPVLFDPAQLLIEHLIMADLLAMVLMVGAFAILLLRRPPPAAACITAGLLMGVSVTVRPTTLPLIIFIPAYLLLSRFGWRKAGAALAAGALPVLAYMGWFAAVQGPFNLTNSNGLFLWSRTMSFANCSVIKPPPDLRALCPDQQRPARFARANPARRPLPKRYLWNHAAWQWQVTHTGFPPDAAAFTPANNDRALRFAVRAIEAQPVTYAKIVIRETLRPLEINNNLRFVSFQPSITTLGSRNQAYALGAVKAYAGSAQGLAHDLGYDFGSHLHQPYAHLVQKYQHVVFLPGPVFAGLLLAGLAGLLLPGRRTGAAALLWVSAIVIMVLPTAEHEYTYRYDIPAVPLICIAAALAFRRPRAALAGAGDVPSPRAAPAAQAEASTRAEAARVEASTRAEAARVEASTRAEAGPQEHSRQDEASRDGAPAPAAPAEPEPAPGPPAAPGTAPPATGAGLNGGTGPAQER